MKTEVFGEEWISMDLPFACEIHPYLPRPSLLPDAKKVLLICTEPRAGMVGNDWIRENYEKFDLIITYDHSIRDLPNVAIQYFGGAFCDERPATKRFAFSFLFSTGNDAPMYAGYRKRKNIAFNFGVAEIPGEMYLSSRRLNITPDELASIFERAKSNNFKAQYAGATKAPAFECMYHIAVENSNDDWYFTEKIVDCFRTFTVPIYWGTSKIDEFFDTRGMIRIDFDTDINQILSRLTPDDYWGRMPYMLDNFERAGRYLDLNGDVKKIILDRIPA